MTDDAKRRALEGLAEFLPDALRVVGEDVRGTLKRTRGSTRVQSAWKTIERVLELPEMRGPDSSGSKMSLDELAEKREQLRQARLAERRQA